MKLKFVQNGIRKTPIRKIPSNKTPPGESPPGKLPPGKFQTYHCCWPNLIMGLYYDLPVGSKCCIFEASLEECDVTQFN